MTIVLSYLAPIKATPCLSKETLFSSSFHPLDLATAIIFFPKATPHSIENPLSNNRKVNNFAYDLLSKLNVARTYYSGPFDTYQLENNLC